MKSNNNSDVKRFTRSFMIIAIGIVVSDFLIGQALRKFYFTQTSGVLSRITYAIDQTEANGLIFGSSRASHHYISDSLTRSLNTHFYNAGKDGQSIFYHYTILQGILERYSPKIVLLDIVSDELDFRQESYDRLGELLPYYHDHPNFASTISLRKENDNYKIISQIYPFNSLFLTIGIGNTSYNKTRFKEINGYLPLVGTYKGGPIKQIDIRTEKIDDNKVNIYEAFIKECKSRNIQLLVLVSPYVKGGARTKSTELASKIASRNQVPFLNFSEHPSFLNQPKYFWDSEHLNDAGAAVFNKLITEKIQKDYFSAR